MRLTAEALASPELREQCPKGTGQIYWWRPLFPTDSNGYIGRNETTLWKRIQGHKTPNSECPGLRNAIATHGLDGFDLVVLQSNIPKSELATAEMRWIATYDTHQRGYNCTPGGEAPPMSVPEIVAKAKATKNTPASRAKTSAASRRHWDNPEEHAVHAAALAESRRKPEVRKKAGVSAKKRWDTPGYRDKMSSVQKVSQNNPVLKAEKAAQLTKIWSDPEVKKSRSQAIREGRARAKAARGGVVKYVRRT